MTEEGAGITFIFTLTLPSPLKGEEAYCIDKKIKPVVWQS